MRNLSIVLLLVAFSCLVGGLLHATESEAEKNFAALSPIGPATTAIQEQAKRCQTDKTIPGVLCDQLRYQAEHSKGMDMGHMIMVEALRRERTQRMTQFFAVAGASFLASLFCFWRANKRRSTG